MKKLTILISALLFTFVASSAHAVSFQYPQVTGNVLMLGATVRENLTTVDSNNTTYRVDNGLQWYSWTVTDGSIGFADISATLDLDSCDTNGSNADVLCWHALADEGVDYLTQGYRWDAQQDVDDASGVYRIMFSSDNPGYYPSGAQYDVPVGDLDGWTACWADDWGAQWGDQNVAFTDLFEACDGDYLMMAVVENVTEGDSPFTIGGEDDLAETGLDSAPIVAVGLLAIVLGAVATRRRHTN